MAYSNDLVIFPFTADADLSSSVYRIVRTSAAGKVNVASLNTSREVLGVLQNAPESGRRADVAIGGISKIEAGAAITANAYVTCDSQGRAITKPSSGTYVVIGRAMQAAGAAGERIAVLLNAPIELKD